jgi:co-chaperonin GroES (HSP10)
MTVRALNKTFIVKRIKKLESAGGIILQHDQDMNPPVVIVSIGPRVEVECSLGQHLAIDWARAGKFAHEGEELFIVHESNVLGVFE